MATAVVRSSTMPVLMPRGPRSCMRSRPWFFGPGLVLLGYGVFTRSGGDFCDAVYALPDGV